MRGGDLYVPEARRLAAIESRNLLRRRPEFFPLIAATRIAELKDAETAVVFRCAYLVARREDDGVDGDRPIQGDIEQYIRRHQGIARQEIVPGVDNYERMLAFSLIRLEEMQRPDDDVRVAWVKMTEAMLFDHKRSKSPQLLTEEELRNYYHENLVHALNLSLICVGSELRAKQLPEMIYIQGTLFSIRDLEKDWPSPRNLYNVPSEVLGVAGIDIRLGSQKSEEKPSG